MNFPLSIKEIKNPAISYEMFMQNIDQLVEYAYKDVTRLFSTRRVTLPQVRRLYEVSFKNNIEDLMELYHM